MDRTNAIAAAQILHLVSAEDASTARAARRDDVRGICAIFARVHKRALLDLGGLPA